MKYKLYKTNSYGQVVDSNGELLKFGNEQDSYIEYSNLDDAKLEAERFLAHFPLLQCVISSNSNEFEPLHIYADPKLREEALNVRLDKKMVRLNWLQRIFNKLIK